MRRSVSEEFLAWPDVQTALADVIRWVPALLKQKWESVHNLAGRQIDGPMAWTAGMVAIVIGAVILLVFNGKISSDSTTFLLGAAE